MHWDHDLGLLDTEKKQVKNLKKLKNPTRCCGNSPGKNHTNNCNFNDPMPDKSDKRKVALSFDSFTGARLQSVVKVKRPSIKARILKKAAKYNAYSQSTGKKETKHIKRGRSMMRKKQSH